jgi:hypothetical protein
MFTVLQTPNVVNLDGSAGTAALTWTLSTAGTLQTNAVFAVLEEAVATGGMTTTAGDYTVQVVRGATTYDVAAWSTGVTATARAIGYQADATTDATNAPKGYFELQAGDKILVVNKAQAAGGTVTGTARVFLPIEIAN